VRREVIARGVVSLFLARPGTQMAPAPYTPGQFVTLVLPSAQGPVYRAYSLSSSGRLDQPWEITIKRQGRVSSYLHDKITVGMILSVNQPGGVFVLPRQVLRDRTLVFIAVGSGITPIIGMLRALSQMPAAQRPPVQLHYASRHLDDIIYRRELEHLDPQRTWLHQWHYLSTAGQRLTASQIIARVGSGAHQALYYLCGPGSLHRDFQTHLGHIGVAPAQIHTETFAAEGAASQAATIPQSRPAAYVSIQQTGAVIDALPYETLLAALERHGYRPAYSCRVGTCGTCKLRVLSGRAQPSGGNVLTQSEQAAGYVLSCIAIPQGNMTLADGGLPPIAGM
ncbi:MAG TPA: 2Fe-2S iron-sulfur cluster-binding protein, partial [Ktedonobacterales bacterium]|nr:2Fe-2S iron-sulfur cluster-binding protein [Ktedonobacterales bacterium]